MSRDALKSTPLKGTKLAIPAGADLQVPGLTPYIVPNADFYRIDTAIVVPRIDANDWKLKVTGMVEREVEIDWKTLQGKQMQEALVTLTCVSNEVGGDLVGNAVWTGWPVRELLAMAGPKAGADMVLQTSIDGFTASTPARRPHRRPQRAARDRDERRAAALRARLPRARRRARALRLRLGDQVGDRAQGDDVCRRRGLLDAARLVGDRDRSRPRRASTSPRPAPSSRRAPSPSPASRGRSTRASPRWRCRSTSGRGPQARLAADASIDTWRQWVYEWDATPGSHDIRVRAYDAKGQVQSPLEAPPAPDGATGIHVVNVRVE